METDIATNPAPEAGTPEHDAALVAVFDSRQVADPNPSDPKPAVAAPAAVPDWVPEEFRSAEDPMKAMAEAYAELQKGAKPVEKPAEGETPKTPEDAAAALESKGIDYDALADSYAANGTLAAADYEALAKVGIPKEAVDAFIEGQEAVATGVRLQVTSAIGGEENFTAMANWAKTSVPKAELAAFNAVVDSGSIDQVKLAVSGLYSRYTAANGVEPNLLGGSRSAVAGDVFRSTVEFTSAIRDPRYAKDPAYRADVEAKLARSSIM